MSRRRSGFLSRMLGRRDADEGETMIYSPEEVGTRRPDKREPEEEEQQGFTVERAARIIDELPPEVPRESAVRIVRGTLMAAGIELVEDLERSTRTREAKLESEIDLSRSRQQELREKTEEAVRSLEDAIRKSQEACDAGIAEEEENISRISARLREVSQVRAFFGFPEIGAGEIAAPSARDLEGDETQSFEPFGTADRTQATRRPDPLADPENSAPHDPYGPASGR